MAKKTSKTNKPDEWLGKKIKITHCTAFGPQFKNLKPDSVHEVVEPPKGFKNGYTKGFKGWHSGVWVKGVGEPVKVLFREFITVEN